MDWRQKDLRISDRKYYVVQKSYQVNYKEKPISKEYVKYKFASFT